MDLVFVLALYTTGLILIILGVWGSLSVMTYLAKLFLERKRELELKQMRTILRPKGYTPVIMPKSKKNAL